MDKNIITKKRVKTTIDKESDEVITRTIDEESFIIKKVKRDKFMLLYVEAFSHLTKLNRKTLEVLALIISRRVTYGSNEVIIDSKFRVEVMAELGMNKQNISRAIKELCDNNVINRKQISDRVFSYYLNPFIFGNGDFNAVERQRVQYYYDFDFNGFSMKKSIEVLTDYADSKTDKVGMEISRKTIDENDLRNEIERLKQELKGLKEIFIKD
ncbi:hypothetical protein CQA53_07365 [Helicobacter didelphidarum]|uniref:Plasmid replication protein RepL domain-containing protein n=1 Tax=Helicobacter didelphidarum TaxID=2040648 RepID=A0A3D8IJZ0_9HELI|nr:hypothetical protein [Helicobacter didelphidarum]RDU64881.1 hypothetical protein CQA53_07365 [Helicobacter didelphidarum]